MKALLLLPPLLLVAEALSVPAKRQEARGDACSAVAEQLRGAPTRKAKRSSRSKGIHKRQSPAEELPKVPGALAQQCIESVPFDANKSKIFVDGLKRYVDFQSTLPILKNPPESYASGPADIFQGLDEIATKEYPSLNAFDTDIHKLAASAHDGHFKMNPCTMDVFDFGLDHPGIVSVSEDGLEMPKVYVKTDIEALKQSNSSQSNSSVSDIAQINGEDAAKFLEAMSESSRSQDPDSRWNELFFSSAWDAAKTLPLQGTFARMGQWPGVANMTIKFTNGTSVTVDTVAVPKDDKPAGSAAEILENYCTPKPPDERGQGEGEEGGKDELKPEPSGIPGYPEPEARDPLNEITGYFLDNETAVLAVSGFAGEGEPDDYGATWAKTARDFMKKAKESGRDKMIIDASGNGGGDPLRFLNLFQMFFPDKFPFDALRFRRTPAIDAITKTFSEVKAQEAAQVELGLAFRGMTTPDQNSSFKTAADILGNEEQNGAPVSTAYTLNFTLVASDENPIEGFSPPTISFKEQPFKTENIILMGNGFCHSSCAGFVNIMANVGGVKTLAFGGRPAAKQMQIMGGVRGGTVLAFGDISGLVGRSSEILENATRTGNETSLLSQAEIADAGADLPEPLESLPYKIDGSVNFENTYVKDDLDRPLQFEFQAADCRLFYTAENILDPKTTWAAAKKVAWGGGKCVEGPAENATGPQSNSTGKASPKESPQGDTQESPQGDTQESPQGDTQESPQESSQESPQRSSQESPQGSAGSSCET